MIFLSFLHNANLFFNICLDKLLLIFFCTDVLCRSNLNDFVWPYVATSIFLWKFPTTRLKYPHYNNNTYFAWCAIDKRTNLLLSNSYLQREREYYCQTADLSRKIPLGDPSQFYFIWYVKRNIFFKPWLEMSVRFFRPDENVINFSGKIIETSRWYSCVFNENRTFVW